MADTKKQGELITEILELTGSNSPHGLVEKSVRDLEKIRDRVKNQFGEKSVKEGYGSSKQHKKAGGKVKGYKHGGFLGRQRDGNKIVSGRYE